MRKALRCEKGTLADFLAAYSVAGDFADSVLDEDVRGWGLGAAFALLNAGQPGKARIWFERAQRERPADSRPAYGLGKPGWLPWVIEEQRATREAVALYDQTSFGKLLLQGRDALAVLQRLCANEVDVPVGRMVYSALLNGRGGFESDLTVIRQAADRFLLVTGSAQPVRDADWINRHIGADEWALLTDVSALTSVISLMGPNARDLLARVSPDDLTPAGLKFSHTKDIDLGHTRVRAARMAYVGGPGFELYVPVEMTRHVYLALTEAGGAFGLVNAGYYALDALRIEMGRRAWGAELGPDESPLEAGLMFAVKADQASDFIGREALRRAADASVRSVPAAAAARRPARPAAMPAPRSWWRRRTVRGP
mgnify:CR=1 FL=1